MNKIILNSLFLLYLAGIMNIHAQTVTYTIQTGNFNSVHTINTNANYFSGAYNNSDTEIGTYGNGGGDGYTGDPGVALFQTFTTDGIGIGTARPLSIGDQFQITCYVGNSSSFFSGSNAGISFNENTTYSSFANYNTNQRLKFQINRDGNWFPAASISGLGYANAGQDVTFTFKLTSTKTANLTISSVNGAITYDMTLANSPESSNPISSFAIWNQTSGASNDMYWKNGSLTSTGTIEVGGNNNTTTISGIISDGIPANATTGTVPNSLTKLGSGTITLTANNTFTGTTTVTAGTLELQGSIASSAVTVQSGATLKINGTDVTVASLTIESGGVVNIEPGKSLTVTGAFSNSGTVTIKSDATGTGSLKTNGTVSGSITAQRYFGGSNWDWHLLSSPVSNQNIQNEFVPAVFTANEDFYCYYEPTSEWVNYKNSTTPPIWATANGDNTFVEGKGYMVSYNSTAFIKSFTGTPNTGSQSFTLSKGQTTGAYIGVNLAGNPYPSSIDWKAATGWTRTGLVDNSGYDMYIWNQSASNYGVYNSSSIGDDGTHSVTRYIPPMQGFFVNAASDEGAFSMTNDVRVHNNASNWLKNDDENNSQFRVVVSSADNNGTDEVVIETGHETSAGGAVKMFSFVESAPSLYLPKENKNYSISFMQDVPVGTTIPLYFGAGVDGQYELAFTFDYQLYTNVKLSDKESGIITDITENSVYQFVSAKDDNPDRFELLFGVTGLSDNTALATLRAYVSHGQLTILGETGELNVDVLDMQGRVLERRAVQMDGSYSQPLNLPAGVYVVRVYNGQAAKSVKVILTNR